MDIRGLEGRLDSAMESYRIQMNNQIESFHLLSDEEKKEGITQTLDAMNMHAYRTFDEFKAGIIEYLRDNK